MYKELPRGTKLSIAFSIKKAFALYMESIDWNDDKYDSDEFVKFWRTYSDENAAWVKEVDQALLKEEAFQEELTSKVNEMIKKTIETEPTKEQIEQIDDLVNKLNASDVDYCCKQEADYRIAQLTKQLK
jgi:uncharacterized protein YpuA (DUF1002 family)